MNLNDFCGKDDIREWFNVPHKIDGKVFATDGAIMIVAPTEGDYADYPRTVVSIRKLISDAESGEYTHVDLPVIEKEPCKRCGGQGKLTIEKCDECEGKGNLWFYGKMHEYECECKECEGNGDIERFGGDTDCPDCEGEGKAVKDYQPIEILGVTVQTKFIEKIQRQNFDDLQFAPSSCKQKLYFKSGNVTGIIMAMRT